MTRFARLTLAGSTIMALGLGVLTAAGGNGADDKQDALNAVRRMADAIEKKDEETVKAQLEIVAKKGSLDEVMHLFALRSKQGEGLGPKPGAITPDGIEAKILNLATGKKQIPEKQLEKEADALARAGYISAAIAEVAIKFAPDRKEGAKDPKEWIAWSKDMKAASIEFAEAAKARKGKEVKAAAVKLNNSCSACHSVFRDS